MDRSPLDADWLRQWSANSQLWGPIHIHHSVASTNTMLASAASDGAQQGVVITAEEQTAGRGRGVKRWQSPVHAGIAVSMLLRPQLPAARWSWLPLLVGVAVCDTLESACAVTATLKWPNDVLVGQTALKVAGILAEVANGGVVVGVGLNVSVQRDEFPDSAATSLALETSQLPSRSELLTTLLDHVEQWYAVWQRSGADAYGSGLDAAYRARSDTLGRQVTANLPDGAVVRGRAADIDCSGRLCIDTAGGRIAVAAGEVQRVR